MQMMPSPFKVDELIIMSHSDEEKLDWLSFCGMKGNSCGILFFFGDITEQTRSLSSASSDGKYVW
jgi:hypothetical protein